MPNLPFTIVQISDLHMDPNDAKHGARLDAVRKAVEKKNPDLIVASGDISADGFKHDNMFERLKEAFAQFKCPVHFIPGNHDVGDKPGEQNVLKPQFLEKWKSVFQDDRFGVQQGPWTILGINTQILGSGLREEADQFEWLDDCLDLAAKQGQSVALFLHAAPFLFEPDEVLKGPSKYWGFDPFPRRELLRRTTRDHVKLVANGHLHWYRSIRRKHALHVWCPSISFIVDDAIFPRGGGVTGFVTYRFTETEVKHELVELELAVETVLFHRRMVELPGRQPVTLAELVLDFSGTLSRDGQLLPGVAQRLQALAKRIRITVLTADTFGTVQDALAGLPLELKVIEKGPEKADYVNQHSSQSVIAIGNGRNDVEMLEAAAIGIAVIGPEGANSKLLQSSDLVTADIHDALDLVANPKRLTASLRE